MTTPTIIPIEVLREIPVKGAKFAFSDEQIEILSARIVAAQKAGGTSIGIQPHDYGISILSGIKMQGFERALKKILPGYKVLQTPEGCFGVGWGVST